MFQVLFICAVTILQLCSNISMNKINTHHLTEFTNETSSNSSTSSDLQEKDYNFKKLAEHYGYTAEEHEIISEDGYILTLHRISQSPKVPVSSKKKVVYIQHGLFMSTLNLILLGPGKNFVFLFSDAGFDVWMGNARGNPFSRSHVSLKPDNKTFWDFSFHEIGLKDVKVFIDTTLNITKQKKVAFVGYSLGVTESLVLFSLLPEYNNKVSIIVEVAPVAFWKYNDNELIKNMFKMVSYFQYWNFWFQIYELFPRTNFSIDPCDEASGIQYYVCTLVKSIAPSVNTNWFDKTYLRTYFKNWPAGTSAKTLFHLAQNVLSGSFRAYDYGTECNIEKYGQKEPPAYSISNIKAPIAIFFGSTDVFSHVKDAEDLKKALPNVVAFKKITHENSTNSSSTLDFSHLDFIFDKEAIRLVYNDLLNLIKKYT